MCYCCFCCCCCRHRRCYVCSCCLLLLLWIVFMRIGRRIHEKDNFVLKLWFILIWNNFFLSPSFWTTEYVFQSKCRNKWFHIDLLVISPKFLAKCPIASHTFRQRIFASHTHTHTHIHTYSHIPNIKFTHTQMGNKFYSNKQTKKKSNKNKFNKFSACAAPNKWTFKTKLIWVSYNWKWKSK